MVSQTPPAPTRTAATFRAAAESAFDYVRRTADRVPDGVRWQTYSYEGERHHSNRLLNGVSGIAAFLAEYYAVMREPAALDLAVSALRWSTAPTQLADSDTTPFRGSAGLRDSLFVGRSGPALAWLHLARVTGDASHLEQARALADAILADQPGPYLYVLTGAAGEGLFFLELWRTIRDERYLDRAIRYGEIAARLAMRDETGILWPAREPAAVPPAGMTFAGGTPTPARLLGYGVGVAGVTHFLAELYADTRDDRWGALTREGADSLVARAVPDRGGVSWNGENLNSPNAAKLSCQWCRGAAGIGPCLARCAAILSRPSYLAVAEAAGECVYAAGDYRQNPSLCHGLGGSGHHFLELHRRTGKTVWRERAEAFAIQALTYRHKTSEGEAWQADEPGLVSPELMYGTAGVGSFYLRLLNSAAPRLPFL